jgi:hypothetical protein
VAWRRRRRRRVKEEEVSHQGGIRKAMSRKSKSNSNIKEEAC